MNVYCLCAVAAGVDTLRMIAGRIPIAGVIGLSERDPSPGISGYIDMRSVCGELGVPFTSVKSYVLANAEDRARLEALPIDVLIVCGWQRLIPSWLIEHVRIGCVGAHGSPSGITAGRGRSPQNWALIAGAQSFEISIFLISPGKDSGPIISSREFRIQTQDDIVSTYLKVNICVAEMLIEAFRTGAVTKRLAEQQEEARAFYLPQRLPEDGAIDWRRSAEEIARFIAALTKPYPGASATFNGELVTFWRARPLDVVHTPLEPGHVIHRAATGQLIIQTGCGLLLVDDYECLSGRVQTGICLESVDFSAQIATIVRRHNARFPQEPVSNLVAELAMRKVGR